MSRNLNRIVTFASAASLVALLAGCSRDKEISRTTVEEEPRQYRSPAAQAPEQPAEPGQPGYRRPGETAQPGEPGYGLGTEPGREPGMAARPGSPAAEGEHETKAEADLKAVGKSKFDATAELEEMANGVRVNVKVKDAEPGAKFVYIHAAEQCDQAAKAKTDTASKTGESPSGATAQRGTGETAADPGSRGAPGQPGATEPSPGDPGRPATGQPGAAQPGGAAGQQMAGFGEQRLLGTITVNKDGEGELEVMIPGANLREGDQMSFLHRAITVRTTAQQGQAQPGQQQQPAVACGEVQTG